MAHSFERHRYASSVGSRYPPVVPAIEIGETLPGFTAVTQCWGAFVAPPSAGSSATPTVRASGIPFSRTDISQWRIRFATRVLPNSAPPAVRTLAAVASAAIHATSSGNVTFSEAAARYTLDITSSIVPFCLSNTPEIRATCPPPFSSPTDLSSSATARVEAVFVCDAAVDRGGGIERDRRDDAVVVDAFGGGVVGTV